MQLPHQPSMLIMVYPTTKTSLVVRHPASGPLKVGGSEWQLDGFTMRMLTDRVITRDKASAYEPLPVISPALDKAITDEIKAGTPKIAKT